MFFRLERIQNTRPSIMVSALLRSRCLAIVVPQHAAESFAASDIAGRRANFLTGIDDLVGEPLVVSLAVIM